MRTIGIVYKEEKKAAEAAPVEAAKTTPPKPKAEKPAEIKPKK